MNTAAKLSVFVADDAEPIRIRIAAALSELENVTLAGAVGSVASAVAGIRQLRPDLVILDISMPDGSGLDVLRQVHEEGIPAEFIVFSQYTDPEYKKSFKDAGAGHFLSKAQGLTTLMALVERVRAAKTATVRKEERE